MNSNFKHLLVILCFITTSNSLIADITEDNIQLYCSLRNQYKNAFAKTMNRFNGNLAIGGGLLAGLLSNRCYHMDPLKSAAAALTCGLTLYTAGQTVFNTPKSFFTAPIHWLAQWLNSSHLWWTGKRTLLKNQFSLLKRNFMRSDFALDDLNNPAFHAQPANIDHLRTKLHDVQQNIQPRDFLIEEVARGGTYPRQVLSAILRLTDPDRFANLPEPDSGMVLAGPTGVGKTEIATQMAALTKAYFMPKGVGDLENMYVGESQKRIKKLFVDARAYRDQQNNLTQAQKDELALQQQETAAWAKLHLDLVQIAEDIDYGLRALPAQERNNRLGEAMSHNQECVEKVQILVNWEGARRQEILIKEQNPQNYRELPAYQDVRQALDQQRPTLLRAAGMENQLPRFHPCCIILVDEFDNIGTRNNNPQEGAAVANQMIGTLLSELDGANKRLNHGVYFVATANRPDLIDPALLRPGRLNVPIHINLPNAEERRELLRCFGGGHGMIGKFNVEDEVRNNYDIVAEHNAHHDDPNYINLVARTADFSHVMIKDLFQNAAQRAALRNPEARRITMHDIAIVLEQMGNQGQQNAPVNMQQQAQGQ